MHPSQKPRVSIIAALGKNRELGKKGELIWRIPDDLKRVKALTMGHPLIMGRKTYASIGRPLPGRTMIVISRGGAPIEGCVVKTSLEDALAYAGDIDHEEVFIFGGAQLYAEGLALSDRLYLTFVDAEDSDADVFFPEYAEIFTKKLAEETHEWNDITYRWVTLERA